MHFQFYYVPRRLLIFAVSLLIMRKTALITGVTSGIGLELARLFAIAGYDLVVVSRSKDKLKRVKEEFEREFHIGVLAIAQDLSLDGAPERIVKELDKREIELDVLINNAGVGEFGLFWEQDPEKIRHMIHLNALALTDLTRLIVPKMVSRGRGRIANIGSVASFFPGPYMAVYFATKAYVLSFTQALSEELSGTGVSATCVCPGRTATGFQRESHQESSRAIKGKRLLSPEFVARLAFDAIMKRDVVCIIGFRAKLNALLSKVLPLWLVRRIAKSKMAPIR
ncbi:SDR family oxidoreductase [Candidatus Woesearchaeota archaeon]|nr:MAG: SDR family oxidoreductase [Candidatus Woesearchaeota archaeon]